MSEDAESLRDRLARLSGRAIVPGLPGDLWDGTPSWKLLSSRVSARALAAPQRLAHEGRRLEIGAPPLLSEETGPLIARPRYCLHGRDILLAGQRGLIDDGDERQEPRLFNDLFLLPAPFFDPVRPFERFPHEYRMTPAVAQSGDYLTLAVDSADVVRIEEPVILVSSTESRNYGSWLFRILPKLLLLDELGEDADDRALLVPQEKPWMIEIVRHLAPNRRVIAHDITRVTWLGDVIAPSIVAPSNIFPDTARLRLQGLVDQALASTTSRTLGTRLYVSRRNWSLKAPRRVLQNEDQVVTQLAARGFKEIFPEEMSFEARVATFAHANIVVGPTGSGLFNTIFCHPATTVIEIEPHDAFRRMHAALYRSLGQLHAFVAGVITDGGISPAHPNWRVDVQSVVEAVGAAKQA